jgi:general L-amino acid transport system permease protein
MPWIRANLFANWMSSLATLAILVLAVSAVPGVLQWAYVDAVFRPDADACQAARGMGACWGVVTEKWRLIVLGRYPFDAQWRPAIASVLLVSLVLASCMRRFWNLWLIAMWLVVIPVFFVLMGGGWLGLSRVPTDNWGGLPLTIMLATFGIALAFPLSVLVALGRRSQLPAIRTACIVYVELIRGVPLISVLFMASFLFPLFLPVGKSPDVLCECSAGSPSSRRRISPKRCAGDCRRFRRARWRRRSRSGSPTGRRNARSCSRRRWRSSCRRS